ncbi:unnamed protein product [Adineta steineri]|uniref:Uncharacterized protein n=1 Tax=Adineta steineri TaxID=433720 RepID=A0A814GAY7_9BILA|nr:unnamed protein product [Adineta steineri]
MESTELKKVRMSSQLGGPCTVSDSKSSDPITGQPSEPTISCNLFSNSNFSVDVKGSSDGEKASSGGVSITVPLP